MIDVEIDGHKYVPRSANALTEEALSLLREVYGALWVEAYYDPYNEYMAKWAPPLADKMRRLNELIGFKK